MKTLSIMKKLKTINTACDYEDVCDDLLNDFLDRLTFDSPYIREVTEKDMEELCIDDCTISFLFTTKGMKLMERYIDRLQRLGDQLFPEDGVEVKCSGIIDF